MIINILPQTSTLRRARKSHPNKVIVSHNPTQCLLLWLMAERSIDKKEQVFAPPHNRHHHVRNNFPSKWMWLLLAGCFSGGTGKMKIYCQQQTDADHFLSGVERCQRRSSGERVAAIAIFGVHWLTRVFNHVSLDSICGFLFYLKISLTFSGQMGHIDQKSKCSELSSTFSHQYLLNSFLKGFTTKVLAENLNINKKKKLVSVSITNAENYVTIV